MRLVAPVSSHSPEIYKSKYPYNCKIQQSENQNRVIYQGALSSGKTDRCERSTDSCPTKWSSSAFRMNPGATRSESVRPAVTTSASRIPPYCETGRHAWWCCNCLTFFAMGFLCGLEFTQTKAIAGSPSLFIEWKCREVHRKKKSGHLSFDEIPSAWLFTQMQCTIIINWK